MCIYYGYTWIYLQNIEFVWSKLSLGELYTDADNDDEDDNDTNDTRWTNNDCTDSLPNVPKPPQSWPPWFYIDDVTNINDVIVILQSAVEF